MKMTKILAAAAIMLALVSCNFVHVSGNFGGKHIKGEGEIVEKTCDISEIKSFTCNVPAVLTITKGTPSLVISTYRNIQDVLRVENKDDELSISSRDGYNFRNDKIHISLSCNSLEKLIINGGVDLKTPGGLSVGDMKIVINGAVNWDSESLVGNSLWMEVNGAGNCEISGIDLKELDIRLNGAGNMELEGKADKASAFISGAGNIDVSDLRSNDLNTKVNGLGRVERD